MKHVALTCKNHTQLRWSCKSLAYTPGRGYNHQRHIFYLGTRLTDEQRKVMGLSENCKTALCEPECVCPPTDLILAPEDEWSKLSEEEQRAAIKADVG